MKTFSPDIRNIGGRELIARIVNNHKNSLSEIATPIAYATPEKSCTLNQSFASSTVRKNRTKSMDYSAPDTLNLSRVLSQNKKKKVSQAEIDHFNELKHLKRRISEIGNVIKYLGKSKEKKSV